MNKTVKYAIEIATIGTALIVGPKACEIYTEKKAAIKYKKEQAYQQKQDAKYEEYIRDSVLTSKNFGKNDNFASQVDSAESQIKELRWQNTPGGALEKAVFSSGEKIVQHYVDILIIDLAKYGLEIKNILEIADDMSKNPEVIMYGAYQDAGIKDTYNAHDYFVKQITKNIDIDLLESINSEEIIQLVDTTMSKMLSELYANRKHIEKSFVPYFAGGQKCIDDCALYKTTDGYCLGYGNAINSPYYTTVNEVEVYDSGLPVNFFGDGDTKYALNHIAKGKWQVSKKSKDGKVAKTQIFNHNVDYKKNVRIEGIKSVNTFAFYPGENIGVHVYDCKVLDVQTAKKKFKQSPVINKQIDSIALRRDSLLQRQQEFVRACQYADSIAHIKLKQRAANKTYSN